MSRHRILLIVAGLWVAGAAALMVKGLWPRESPTQREEPPRIPVAVFSQGDPALAAKLAEAREIEEEIGRLEASWTRQREELIRAFNTATAERPSGIAIRPLPETADLDLIGKAITSTNLAIGEYLAKRGEEREADIRNQRARWTEQIGLWKEEASRLAALKKEIEGKTEPDFWVKGEDRKWKGVEWVWISDPAKNQGGFWVSRTEWRLAALDEAAIPASHAGEKELRDGVAVMVAEPDIQRLRDQAARAVTRSHNWNAVMTNPGLAAFRSRVQSRYDSLLASERARLRREAEARAFQPLEAFPKAASQVTATRPEEVETTVAAITGNLGGGPDWNFRLPTETEWQTYSARSDRLDGIGTPEFSEWVRSGNGLKVVDRNWKGDPTTPPAPGTASFRLVFASD